MIFSFLIYCYYVNRIVRVQGKWWKGSITSYNDSCPTIVTNANGTAFKFPNGMMICTKTVTATITFTAWGTIYESSSISLGDWAVPFVSVPVASYSLNNSESGAIAVAGGGNITTSSAGYGKVTRPNNTGTTATTIGIIAVGLWK